MTRGHLIYRMTHPIERPRAQLSDHLNNDSELPNRVDLISIHTGGYSGLIVKIKECADRHRKKPQHREGPCGLLVKIVERGEGLQVASD